MKIHKYSILIKDNYTVEMPRKAVILSFQMQNDIPTLWVLVDEKETTEKRKFSIVGTGEELDMDKVKCFIGTVQQNYGNLAINGSLVWHLFEMK